jgi:hypothetical protein
MALADEIREFALTRYIGPARKRGEWAVTIRAGDVHKEMGLKLNQLPGVCSALGTNTFETQCDARRISADGPLAGANLLLTFRLRET